MRRAAACLAASALLGGCLRVTSDMADQPRLDPADASPLFADGVATRPPPPGSVAHASGDAAAVSSGRRGLEGPTPDKPPPLSLAQLERGRERYTIYCLPCHGATGAGDGEVVRRGFPRPPSLMYELPTAEGDQRRHDTILHGTGRMNAFADRIGGADAWAIVAYLRALRFSQRAPVAALPADLQQALARLPGEAASGVAR